MQRNVVIVGLWRSGISGLTDYFLGETRHSDISLFGGRYQVEHPEASPESIEASKDFVRCIAFGVEGQYDDPMACMSTVVQMYKNFTGGWQWQNHPKIPDNVTLSTSNVSTYWQKLRQIVMLADEYQYIKYVLQPELGLARRSERDAMQAWYTLCILARSFGKTTGTSTTDREFELKFGQRSSSMRSLRLEWANTSSQPVAQALVEVYTIE